MLFLHKEYQLKQLRYIYGAGLEWVGLALLPEGILGNVIRHAICCHVVSVDHSGSCQLEYVLSPATVHRPEL